MIPRELVHTFGTLDQCVAAESQRGQGVLIVDHPNGDVEVTAHPSVPARVVYRPGCTNA